MTDRLRRAFDEAAKLSEDRQNAWGEAWLAELSTEMVEDEIRSGKRPMPPRLQEILDEASKDIEAGRTRATDELFG